MPRAAPFVSTDELVETFAAAGFSEPEPVQTVFGRPGDVDEPEPVGEGYGDGSFVGPRVAR